MVCPSRNLKDTTMLSIPCKVSKQTCKNSKKFARDYNTGRMQIVNSTGFIWLFCRMFSFGEFKQEDQDKMLAALNKKVAEVYGACIGQNEANIRYIMVVLVTL